MVMTKKMQAGKCDPPQEMIIHILSRLPVKSLLKFKCVSKEWFNLISSSDPGSVKQKHDMRMDQTPYLIIWNDSCIDESDGTDKNYWPFVDEITIRFSVIGLLTETLHNRFELILPSDRTPEVRSCHGLVCFMNFVHNYVFNPSTQELLKLPNLHGNKRAASITGFGYLPNKNEYKIVAWFKLSSSDPEEVYNDKNLEMGCQILSLTDSGHVKTGTWRVIANRPASAMGLMCCPLCVNGVIYWLSWNRGDLIQFDHFLGFYRLRATLFSFDLEKEEYQLRSCPDFRQTTWGDLVEFEGCLCVGDFLREESMMNLWKFKNNVWEMKYSIKFPSNITRPSSLIAYISKGVNGEEELIFMTDYVANGLLFYNIGNGSYRRPENFRQFVIRGYERPFLCFESLFCLGGV